jgi:hypothetical protein
MTDQQSQLGYSRNDAGAAFSDLPHVVAARMNPALASKPLDRLHASIERALADRINPQ